jgi:DNA-binding IclR family transcriptional regulator
LIYTFIFWKFFFRKLIMSTETEKDQPLDRALAVIEAVAAAARPLSMTDIAQHCGLPLPTVHRLAAQVEARGLIKRVVGTRKFVVGFRLLRLGYASMEAALRADLPHQVLARLAESLGEHCHIGVRSDNSVVYVDTVKANRSQGLYFDMGRRSPLHCTSIGKLFLANMPVEEFDAWLRHAELEPVTPKTILKPAQLRKTVDTVRRTGWATSDEEVAAGVVGCAVPIRDGAGRLVAGLGISAPSAHVSHAELTELRPRMEAAATEIRSWLTEQG